METGEAPGILKVYIRGQWKHNEGARDNDEFKDWSGRALLKEMLKEMLKELMKTLLKALSCRSWAWRQAGKDSESIQKEVDARRIHRQESVRLRDAGAIQKTLNLF